MDAVLLVLVLVIAALAIALALFWWRSRRPAPAPQVEATITERADEPAAPPPVQMTAAPADESAPASAPEMMAVLEVTDGPEAFLNGESVGRRIEIRRRRVTIGRNPRQVDIQLYDLDQPSSVSRLHCTIEFHEALRCFFITDEGSSSGTKVAGQPLKPYKQQSLKDGDVIELGLKGQMGTTLRFSSPYTPPERLSVEKVIEPKDTIRHPVPGHRASTQPLRRDVFISYSRKDRDQMHIIREGLLAHGLTVWSDESLEPGSQSWRRDVQLALEGARCVVAILSPDAKDSEWVSEELGYARIRRLPILTVLARGDESNAIPFGLTGVQWIDMRADYEDGIREIVEQAALEKLVTAVREQTGR